MRIYLTLLISLLFRLQLFSQIPAINAFSPSSGPVGTTVIITGTNFSTIPANNIVFFGAVKATVTTASSTSLAVTVPSGATYQPITITINGLTASAAKPFIVTFSGGGSAFTASSFAPKIDYAAGLGPACIATSDLDGDGKPDLIEVNESPNTVSVFKNVSTAGTISFSLKTDYGTGGKPYCVVAGDLDGDGKPDLAVANGSSNTVSVFRNTSIGGNISFAPKIDLLSGSFPFCVVIKDFDGDGKPDVVSANSSSNTISIFKNNSIPGSISFSLKSDFVTGISPFWLAAGDLDEDGKPELATANGAISNSVSVLRNTSTIGSISFAPKTDFDGGRSSYSIAMGDINGDGKLDLAIASQGPVSLAVLLNTSTGTGNISFAQKATFQALNTSYGVTLNDMDGDGKPDIVIANSDFNSVSVFKNKSIAGVLSLDQKNDYLVGTNPWVTAVVDLNGDGKPDIATANYGSANISVLRNTVSATGVQSFTPSSAGSGTVVTINGLNFIGVTAVNFGGVLAASFTVNSSTSIAAVVAGGASGNVAVITNNDTFSLAGFTFLPAPSIASFNPTIAGTGDTIIITGTNYSDVNAVSFGGVQATSFATISSTSLSAVVGAGTSGNVSVTTPGGTASFAGFTYIPPPVVTSFTPVNADTGSIDTIAGNYFTGTTLVKFGETTARSFTVVSDNIITAIASTITGGSVSVSTPFGTGKLGGFYNGHLITSFGPASGPVGTIVTINGINFNNNPINNIVYFGAVRANVTSATTNALTVVVPAGSTHQPVSVTCNQLIAFADKPFIQTFINTDSLFVSSSFAPKIDFTTGPNPNGVSVGDLDGDGKPDLVTANQGNGFVSVFKNTGSKTNISFTKTDLFSGGCNNLSVYDMDGDGKPDIIASNNSQIISILKNNSSSGIISFSSYLQLTFGGDSHYRLAIHDIDGDGKPDIAVTQNLNNRVLIFRNTTINGVISFAPSVSYATGTDPLGTFLGDLNGDGRPDLIVSNFNSAKISVYKNTSTSGIILFDPPEGIVSPYGLASILISDFDGDGKPDIVASNTVDTSVIIFRNTETTGNISFDQPKRFLAGINIYDLSVQDMDGDGRPDIAGVSINSKKLSILKNESVNGNILFASMAEYDTETDPISLAISDFDGDEKADVAIVNFHSNSLSLYRNKMSEVNPIILCPPSANTSILSSITGLNYQWQLNADNGFSNIFNNSNYSGSNSATLQLISIPSSWYGYKYRCLVDGNISDVFEVRFGNSWIGAINSAWENASNWSCGAIPDINTDVIIKSGTIVINSNITIRSLKVSPVVTLTINPGFNLTVSH